jgi:hypothetical protein
MGNQVVFNQVSPMKLPTNITDSIYWPIIRKQLKEKSIEEMKEIEHPIETDNPIWDFIASNEKRIIGRKLREVQYFLMECGVPYRTFEIGKVKNLTNERNDSRVNLEIKDDIVTKAFPDSFIAVEIMY